MSERALPDRRTHFVGLIEWAGAQWSVGIGLDPQGVAVEIFADCADPAAKVDAALAQFVHAAFITLSHYLRTGVRASAHAERLASRSPDLLELALREAVKVEEEEGAKVRAVAAWQAGQLSFAGLLAPFRSEEIEAYCRRGAYRGTGIEAYRPALREASEAELRAQRLSWARGQAAMGSDRQEAEDLAAWEAEHPVP